jgi:hypothetical protein
MPGSGWALAVGSAPSTALSRWTFQQITQEYMQANVQRHDPVVALTDDIMMFAGQKGLYGFSNGFLLNRDLH